MFCSINHNKADDEKTPLNLNEPLKTNTLKIIRRKGSLDKHQKSLPKAPRMKPNSQPGTVGLGFRV